MFALGFRFLVLCGVLVACSRVSPTYQERPLSAPPPVEDYAAKAKFLDACLASKHFTNFVKGTPQDSSGYCRCIIKYFYAERICKTGNCEGMLSEKAVNMLRDSVEMRIQCGEF